MNFMISDLVLRMTSLHTLIMVATLMPYSSTWLKPLTKSFISIYVTNYHTTELMATNYNLCGSTTLKNRDQAVVLEGEHSTPCKVLSGVPQATLLAPLLFLIYVNDTPSSITNMLRLYADDAPSLIRLLIALAYKLTLQKWTEIWQMQFNPDKCEHLQIAISSIFTTHYMATLYKKSKMLSTSE